MKFSRPFQQGDSSPRMITLQGCVNSDSWRGYRPRTCRIDNIRSERYGHTETYITVSPAGFDYHVLDTDTMQVGQVIQVLEGVDFNEYDFGDNVPDDRRCPY